MSKEKKCNCLYCGFNVELPKFDIELPTFDVDLSKWRNKTPKMEFYQCKNRRITEKKQQ
jgi:hypothetical protein